MGPLFNETRNWKWMVPATLILPLVPIYGWMATHGWQEWLIVPGGLVVILLMATVVNLGLLLWERGSQVYADYIATRNATPEVRMLEAAKGMHPDAVKALLVHRRSIWRIKYVPLKDTVDWIFDEAPSLHAGFVDFVLDNSRNGSLMSKRLLSEGSKQFDPEELMTDYEQYNDLVHLMQSKLMITEALGSQAPKWLPPWNADLARHLFGLDGAPYAVEEEGISDAMKAVMRAQSKWQGNGKMKDLGVESGKVESGQSSVSREQPSVDAMTDEELAATQRIQAEHDARWKLPDVKSVLRTGDELNRQMKK